MSALAGLTALALTLVFGAAVATAEHKLVLFDFGSAGTKGGQFNSTRGIALNESGSGGVAVGTAYVVDFNNNRIQSFDAEGNFLRTWGRDVDAVNPSTEYEVCAVAENCKAGVSGSGAGQFSGIAGGIAVDQATGTVYVIDRTNNRIQFFDAEGNFLGTWGWDVDAVNPSTGYEVCTVAANCKAGVVGSGTGQFNFGSAVVGIGIDSAGSVYASDANNSRLQKFSSTGAFLAMGGWDVDAVNPSTEYETCTVAANCKGGIAGSGAGQFASGTPSFLAVSPSGDVYAVDATNQKIVRLDSSLALVDPQFTPTVVAGGGVPRAVTVNRADGHVFLAKSEDINIYEIDPSSESEVHKHPAEAANWFGLAINSITGRIYAAQNAGTFVRVLGESDTRPHATVEPPEPTSWSGATLKGTVDPEGVALLTECFFEWGPTTSYGNIASCTESPAEIGAGTDPVPVHAEIGGLAPNGGAYHVRLVASNENGADKSDDEAFSTPEAVKTLPATAISGTAATLNGSVNPFGNPLTDCLFQYTDQASFEASGFETAEETQCVPSAAAIGAGTSPVAVQADVGALQPGTVYRFRLLAANAIDGEVAGGDLSFQSLGAAIKAAWAEDVGLKEATLKAEIDPEGKATTYRFEYGDQGPCSSNPCASKPVPDAFVGSDSSAHVVVAVLEGLAPGTTYHFRVVATNSDAANAGPDRRFTTYLPLAVDSCSDNRAFRVGPSANLPDCRAYEMVSPPDKGGGDIVATVSLEDRREAAFRQASTDGERITYTSPSAFGDVLRSTASNQYLASRGAAGWVSHGLYPPQGTTLLPRPHEEYDLDTNFQAFTPDLCFALMRDHNLVPLTPDAIAGHTNLYLRDNCAPGADSYRALTIGAEPAYSQHGADLFLQGRAYSRDLSHIVFSATAALESTPAPSGAEKANAPQLYDFTGGQLRLVSVLPGGEANPDASFLGSAPTGSKRDPARTSSLSRAVSEDGSRIFWTSVKGGARTIYVRIDSTETLPVSGTGSDVQFWTASGDGLAAIFSEGAELFEFDVEKAMAADPGAKTSIAGEVGGVVGASEDLSRLYFTSKEALAGGASAGEWNLYLREGGTVRFVATVAPEDRVGFGIDSREPITRASRVSPDGRHLTFISLRSLTGFENIDPEAGEAVREVYLYDAAGGGGAGELLCVSCNPSGARPTGDVLRPPYSRPGESFTDGVERWAAAWIPTSEWTSYGSRPLADDGSRLFFNAFDALVPEDTNEAQDVYQWEAPGTGTCEVGGARYFPQNGGCVSLISTGKNEAESVFFDASADGRDVFFTTASNIDPRDLGFIDVYDAREGGGYPPPPPPPPPCVGDACQSVPAPPGLRTPASESFRGPGDPAAGRDCGILARRAANLARRAKRSEGRRAARLARKAKRLGKAAKRCRRANRRAGR